MYIKKSLSTENEKGKRGSIVILTYKILTTVSCVLLKVGHKFVEIQ